MILERTSFFKTINTEKIKFKEIGIHAYPLHFYKDIIFHATRKIELIRTAVPPWNQSLWLFP